MKWILHCFMLSCHAMLSCNVVMLSCHVVMSCRHIMPSCHVVICCHIMSCCHVAMLSCCYVMLSCYVVMLCHVMLCHVLMHYVFKKSCPVIIPCGHVLVSSSGVHSSWGIREFSKSIAETNPGWPNSRWGWPSTEWIYLFISKTLSLLWGWLPTGRRFMGRTRPRDVLYFGPTRPPSSYALSCYATLSHHGTISWWNDMAIRYVVMLKGPGPKKSLNFLFWEQVWRVSAMKFNILKFTCSTSSVKNLLMNPTILPNT
jgi:hypothetical protein